MRFLRQTLLAVCLILPCALVVGQPITVNDAVSGSEDSDIIINILGNDEPVGSVINPASVDLDPAVVGIDPAFTVTEGTFAVDALGVVTFTPLPDFNGDVTEITYTVSDEDDNVSAPAIINVTVDPVNDPPSITVNSSVTTLEDTPTDVSFTISDIDSDPSTFEVEGAVSSNTTIIPDENFSFSGSGATHTVTITPAQNENGGPVTVTITVNDGEDSNQADLDVSITPVNDRPTISPIENQVINVNTSTNELTFTISDVETDPADLVVSGSSGNTTIIPDANFSFGGGGAERTVIVTPAPNQSGGPVQATIHVSDGSPVEGTRTFDITVTAVDAPPTISPIGPQITNEDTPLVVPFTVGDPDTDLSLLNIAATSSDDAIIPDASFVFSGSGTDRTLSMMPASNQSGGPVTITLEVGDGTETVSTTFTVTVNAVNDPPTITPLGAQITTEDVTLGPLTLAITDVDTPLGSLTLSGTSSNQTLIPNANITFGTSGGNRTITVVPAANQSSGTPVTITVNVTDAPNAPVTMTFDVTVTPVNDPPTITPLGAQTVLEDGTLGPLTLAITDIDTPLGSLTLSGTSSNQTLIPDANITFGTSGGDRTITVVPAANLSGGPVTITVSVTDAPNSPVTMTFDVTVTPVNDPPTITPLGAQTVLEDGTLGPLTLAITDIDTPLGSLTLSGTSSNQTLIPDANITFGTSGGNRTITVVPAANLSGGPVTITVSVTDAPNPAVTMTFNVTVTPVNDPPTITPLGAQTVLEDGTLGPLTLAITDIDTPLGSLTLSGTSSNQTLIPDANITFGTSGGDRTITVVPAANVSGGPVTITVSVTDAPNPAVTMTFNVTVTPVNDPPTITPLGAQTVLEDGTLGPLTLAITDVDTSLGSLTLSGTSSNQTLIPDANITFGTSGGDRTITVVPAANQSGGPVTITVSVTDAPNPPVTMTFNVTVTPVNDPPTITPLGAQTVLEDGTLGPLTLAITDIDTPLESLTLSGTSSNTTIIPNANITFGTSGGNRTITVVPAANLSGGPVTITVSVTDAPNPAVTMTFNVTVTPVNDPPTIAALSAQVIPEDGSTGALTLTITDPDDAIGSLTLTGTSDNDAIIPDANVTFGTSGGNRTVTVTPLADQNGGPVSITVTVSDGVNPTATMSFDVTVTPVNDPPAIVPLTAQIIPEDGTTGALTLSITDIDTPIGSLTLAGSSNNDAIIPDANVIFGSSGGNRTVTVTPAPNQNGGPVTITVSVTDAPNPPVTMNFNVTVTPVNDPPTIVPLDAQVILEDGTTGPITLAITDPDNAIGSLTLTGTSDNDAIIPDANVTFGTSGGNRTVTVTPLANQSGGPVNITVSVSDGVNSAVSMSFPVTVTPVNDPPTIVPLTAQIITEDGTTGALILTISDPDDAIGSLTLTGASNNDAIIPDANIVFGTSGANRTVTVTPAPDQNGGPVSITVNVSDGVNPPVAMSFNVTVSPVNDPPTIAPLTDLVIPEDGTTGALVLTITDPDNAIGSLTLTGASDADAIIPDANIVFGTSGGNRTVTVTPLANQSGGPVNITVSVSDGVNAAATINFNVTVTPVDDPPTIALLAPQFIAEDASTGPLTLTITDSDTPLNSLTLTGASDNDVVIPDANVVFGTSAGNRTVTVTPAPNQNGGPVSITVSVSDGINPPVSMSFNVTVIPVNDPPTITAIGNQTINEDTPSDALDFVISDIDNPVGTLTLTGSSNATGIISNANIVFGGSGTDRTVTLTPSPDQNGLALITITVSDGSLSVPMSFAVTVAAVNDPPTITSIPSQLLPEDGTTGPLSFTLTDVDNPVGTLTVSASSDNPTMVPNGNIVFGGSGASRTVTVTPAIDQTGVAIITLTVSDGTNSVSITFQVTVDSFNDSPTISAIGNQSTNEDVPTAVIPFTIGDPETPAGDLVVTATSDNVGVIPNENIILAGSGANRTVQIIPEENQSGAANITLTVSDGENTTSISFQVTVNTVNDPPTITPIANQTIDEDGQTTALPFIVNDVETAVASLSVTVGSDNLVLVPLANIILGGSGGNRTVQVTPAANQNGVAIITVSVNDGTNTTSATFQVTVNSINDLPTITPIANQTIDEDNPTPALAFTVADTETPLASLTITGSSDNATLVPTANIVFGGSGGNRTVTITPAANQFGVATITMSVNDGTVVVPTTFQVTVNSINDAPLITGQNPVSTDEEQPLEIDFSHLIVADPDNAYPTGFTLTVLPNPTQYSLAGNQITPNTNVTTTLTVPVQVSDGVLSSNSFNLQVTIVPVNDPPVITVTTPLTTPEDNAVTVLLSHLTISDPDNTSFTFALAPGSNYTVNGAVVTPAANYNGTLLIPVTVNDGLATSAPVNISVQVTPVNDKPEITGQIPVSIAEVEPVTIRVEDITIYDPDNNYPGDFTLLVSSGANYVASGNTVTPVSNFSGTLQVQILVNDGQLNSDIYSFQILVNSTNDAPVITGQNPNPLGTDENEEVEIELEYLIVTDPDNDFPADFTLTVLPGTTYTHNGTKVTPNANINGVIDVMVKVNDGNVDSAPYPFKLVVSGINDAPKIDGQYALGINEEGSIILRIADLQITDPDSPPSTFVLTVLPGSNYTIAADNPHKVTPIVDYFGTLSVPVTVSDGLATSQPYNVQINVAPINDAPIIIGQNPLSTEEDQPITLTLGDFNVTDVDNTYPIGFSLQIPQGNGINYKVTGNTVTPNPDFNGTLGVNVSVSDGVALSNTFPVQITVENINDPPTLNVISNVNISEDPTEAIVVPLTGITAGVGEATQTLVVTASSNQPEWFDVFEVSYVTGQEGSLKIKPKANQNGTAQITVRITDNGANSPAPNINFFERSFDFIIDPVNDPPTFKSEPNSLVAEAGRPFEYKIMAEDVEDDVITFTTVTLPSWLTLTQTDNENATLSGIPPSGATGQITIVIVAADEQSQTSQTVPIVLNTRPSLEQFDVTIWEDNSHEFKNDFIENYFDADGHPLAKIQIKQLPEKGKLFLGDNEVTLDAEIPGTQTQQLKYVPMKDSTGTDIIKWNASDGLSYSLVDANIIVTIRGVNDPPEIIALELPENDTLIYEMGGEIPVPLTKIFDARDADGDDIVGAEIAFVDPLNNFNKDRDQLLFTDTAGIRGHFNTDFGVLTLAGKASVKEYVAAIRSIKYNYLNADANIPANKRVAIKLSDGDFGGTKERLIGLINVLIEIDIANAFTPTGSSPYWNIYSPNGLTRYKDALIRVYNKRGTLVYEATGFGNQWDGNGPDGNALPPDSYYYTIDLKYDKRKYQGVVTILR